MATQKPVIVIVGPTASGKTGLAIKIAKQFNGEIISADSRAIYKGMDIGTAKPSTEEQDSIKHWGIDLVEPDERFTAADFQMYANKKIDEIKKKGKLPVLAGGSGLYIDSVIYNYNFTNDYDKKQRDRLNRMSIKELQEYCINNNINLPNNSKNKRYLIREIERGGRTSEDRNSVREDAIIVGIETEKEYLMSRITNRAEKMFCDGLYEEVKNLVEKYSFESEAMKSNIYPIVWRYMNGELSRDEAVRLSIADDWHLAKKQMTWFRRNSYIKWLPLVNVEEYLAKKLFSLNK